MTMELLNELELTLKKDERFIGENEQIIKTRVADSVRSNDSTLLKELLDNYVLRNSFFTKVDDIYVFDKNKFIWVLESKEFLPDSYTMYKNKIGLVDKNNNLISQNRDVSLVWPYKDCILEGGQTKEDQKRDEIFYNEILAPDQVNKLLSPKIFRNAKRYTKDGVEDNVEFNEDDNLIIKGNNLLALSSLLEIYEGKVKCIFIDPPYNTGNDSFGYNDNFNHSTWLTFMKNRLELARKLLSEDGVIFVQCDDNEQAYLKVLMDEIYGSDKFINCLVIKMSDASGQKMSHIESKFPKIKEYLLLYKKQNTSLKPIREAKNKVDKEYKIFFDVDKNVIETLKNDYISNEDIRNLKKILLENMITFNEAKKKYGISKKNELMFFEENLYRLARTSNSKSIKKQVEIDKNLKDKVEIIKYKDNYILVKADYDKKSNDPRVQYVFAEDTYFSPICDLWLNISTSINYEGGVKFKNAKKPEKLIYQAIESTTDENDLVLDFFLGSGTTSAVAHKMNRRYIGVEQMNYVDTVAVPRLRNVINGEQGGISKSVNWNGGGSFVYCELLEDNENLINELEEAKSSKEIKKVLNKAIDNGKIISSILPNNLKDLECEFYNLKFDEKKNLVMEILNKNHLYVNLSDIDDEEYKISEQDKKFTKSIYGLDKEYYYD